MALDTSVPTVASIQALSALDSFVGFGGVSLRVSQRSWAAGTDLDDVLSGAAVPDRIIATQDGRAIGRGWHAGSFTGDDVYFERYEVRDGALVMVSHGWVNPATRRITQVG